MTNLFTPAVNKVPGYCPKVITALVNKPINPADFCTLKIWDQSDHWLKIYGQKVHLWPKQLFGHNF